MGRWRKQHGKQRDWEVSVRAGNGWGQLGTHVLSWGPTRAEGNEGEQTGEAPPQLGSQCCTAAVCGSQTKEGTLQGWAAPRGSTGDREAAKPGGAWAGLGSLRSGTQRLLLLWTVFPAARKEDARALGFLRAQEPRTSLESNHILEMGECLLAFPALRLRA